MPKSRFRIAGDVLVLTTLAGSAAAQSSRAPINTLNELEAALLDCWVPPPMEQSRPCMQITVLISFKRNGELFGQPRIKEAQRLSVSATAVRWRLETAWPASRSPCASSMIGTGPPTSPPTRSSRHRVNVIGSIDPLAQCRLWPQ